MILSVSKLSMLIFSLSRIFSCQLSQKDSVSSVNRDEFESFWNRLNELNMMKEVEVSSLVNCSRCCSFIIWSWSFLKFKFNRSFAWSIFSKQVFYICSLKILSNNSQASTSRSRWVWRLFRSSRKTSESCLTQCCSCSTFLISQRIETFRDLLNVWEWDMNWWCFCTKSVLRNFDRWEDNSK